MKYLLPSLAIVSIVSWCVFLLNQQRNEIISLKKQLKECNTKCDELNTSNEVWYNDNEYLHGALKNLTEACQ